jgi:hypothetical protein
MGSSKSLKRTWPAGKAFIAFCHQTLWSAKIYRKEMSRLSPWICGRVDGFENEEGMYKVTALRWCVDAVAIRNVALKALQGRGAGKVDR